MINWFKPFLTDLEKSYVQDALDSTWISGGKYVDRFEDELAKAIDTEHVITTSNGTASLDLALKILGIKQNDEVIVPGFTFAAPANMILNVGAKPVYVDICPNTWLIDPKKIESNITNKTAAIIPVHIYGNICDMSAIQTIAKKHRITIIEDTAEAIFSRYQNKYAGTIGDVGCFSFQATKTITTGEGGAISIRSTHLKKLAKLYRSHGMGEKRYWHEVPGHNFRLTNLQAALGCAQLVKLDTILGNKRRVYDRYVNNLKDVSGLKLQQITAGCDPIMWAFAVRIDTEALECSRDTIIYRLLELGIETRPGFYPFSEMPIYGAPKLEQSIKVSQEIISLPSYATLSDTEIDDVCERFINLLQTCKR